MQINAIISQSLQESKESREKNWVITQFRRHFKNVMEGLKNMKKTYMEDSSVVARLTVICALLEEEIKEIELLTERHERVGEHSKEERHNGLTLTS